YLRGGPALADVRESYSRVKEALSQPAAGRTLLVLDGLERVQREAEVRGQFTGDAGPLRWLLQWAAAHRPTGLWVLTTSRFPLTDLVDFKGAGYGVVEVDELEEAAARSLLRAQGVRGTDEDLDLLLREFGRHALSLTHLGGLLAEYHDG